MNFMALDPSVRWTLAGIGGVLVLATIIVQVLVRWKPDADFTSLRQRVNSWWVMASVFTLAMILSRSVSISFFAFISFLALKEFLSLIPTRRADRRRPGRARHLAGHGHRNRRLVPEEALGRRRPDPESLSAARDEGRERLRAERAQRGM